LQSTDVGLDGPLAVWDALCKLEQLLRDARSRRCTAAIDDRPAHRRPAALDHGGFS
jgi:hypothetical protein